MVLGVQHDQIIHAIAYDYAKLKYGVIVGQRGFIAKGLHNDCSISAVIYWGFLLLVVNCCVCFWILV